MKTDRCVCKGCEAWGEGVGVCEELVSSESSEIEVAGISVKEVKDILARMQWCLESIKSFLIIVSDGNQEKGYLNASYRKFQYSFGRQSVRVQGMG